MRPRSKQVQIHCLHPMALALARAGIIGTLACGLPLSAAAQQAALPTGGSVVAGSATISNPTASSQRITQSSDKAIIDWQGFSIGKPNSVQFVQPGSGSVVLNRVVGDNPSAIYGSLSANGQVFLVNPRGIYFGPGASLDVGGLVASTLDISNKDFLDGNYVFSRSDASGSGAGITNAGTINTKTGGYVVLAGDYANNSGVIRANVGQVALAAGKKVTLDLNGDHLINLAVNEKTLSNLAGVSNSGKIVADGGKVVMTAATARSLAGTVVNNTGVIQATGTVEKNGAIYLMGDGGDVSSSGTLNASGVNGGSVTVQSKTGTTLVSGNIDVNGTAGQGGTAQILGERVGLTDHADVNASGTTGGGTVLVGGDYQGRNAAVQNADATYLGGDATIEADAVDSGNGGKVVLWSEQATRAYGKISARGGASGGNGGLVETSSENYLQVTRAPDASAPYGAAGTWLIDPNDLTIVSGSGNTNINSTNPFQTTGDSASLGVDLIASALTGGTTVTVSTGTAGTNAQQGNLTWNTGVTLDYNGKGSNTLNLNATNDITFSGVITDSVPSSVDKLAVNFTAGGAITLDAGSNIATGGANFTALANNGTLTANGTINAGAGDVTLTTAENGAAPAANGGFRDILLAGNITGSVVTLNSANGVNQTAGGITATSGLLARGSFGNSDSAILLTGPNNNISTLAIEKNTVSPCTPGPCPGAGTGNVVVVNVNNGANKLTVGSVGGVNGITTKPTDSAVTLTAGDIDVNQAINAGSGTVVLQPYTSATTVTVGTATGVANEFALTQTDLDWITAGALRLGSTANTATMTINAVIHTPDTSATPGTWDTLTLLSGGDITEAGGALGDANNPITNLAVVAAGNVTLTNSANQISTLAASVTGSGKSLQFVNSGAFAIGHVKKGIVPNYDFSIHDLNPSPPPPEPLDGITTNNGNVYVETRNGGALGLAKDMSAGTGTVEINSGGGVTNSGGAIQAAGLLLEGAGSFALTQSSNDVGTLAAKQTSGQLNLSYTGKAGSTLTVGAVNDISSTAVNGITTGGNVTLTADNMTFTQGISAGNVTLTSSDAARTINLGSGVGGLDLTGTTLGNVTASGTLTIGDAAHTGNIVVTGNVDPANSGNLALNSGSGDITVNGVLTTTSAVSLTAGGAITDNVGTNGIVTAALTTSSGTGTSLTGSGNQVSNFSATNASSGDINFVNSAGDLVISGITQNNNGNVLIETAGKLSQANSTSTIIASNNVTLKSDNDTITVGANITAGLTSTITLDASGAITQSAGTALTGGVLSLKTAGGDVTLASMDSSTPPKPANNVGNINGDVNGNLTYVDKDVLSAGPINTHGHTINLSAGASLILSGNLDAAGATVILTASNGGVSQLASSAVTTSSLLLMGTGPFNLNQGGTVNPATNNVDTIAADITGALTYNDADTLAVSSVGGTSGINTHNGNVTLNTDGALTLINSVNAGSGAITFTSAGVNQTGGALAAGSLTLGGSGTFALAQSGNDVGALAADITGNLNYHDASALTVGVGSTGVFTHSGNINIETQNGTLALNQPVDAAVIPNVRPTPNTATAGNVTLSTLTSGNINIDADVTGNTVTINSAAGVRQNATIYSSAGATATINGDYWRNFTSDGSVQGITLVPTVSNPHPTLILSAGGAVTVGQSGVLKASNLLLYGYSGSPTFNLTNANNSFGTVAVGNNLFGLSGTPNVNLAMNGGIVIGDVLSHDYGVSASGITTGGGNVTLTAGAGGLNGGITLSSGINTTDSAGTVTLINDAPGNVIQTASGAIITQTLNLNGQGSFLLGTANNNLTTLNASITGAALSYRELNEIYIGNVNVSNSGSVAVNLQAPNSWLQVSGGITATSTGNVAPATVNIYGATGVAVNGAISATGGGNGTGDNAGVYISTTNGPIVQNAAISATDNGGSTLSTSAPHSATVMMSAGSKLCSPLFGCYVANAGLVTAAGPINVTSSHGRAVADIFGQTGVDVENSIIVTGETAPMLQLSGNLVDDSDPKNPKLVSSANVTVNGALTLTTTGNNAAPSNTVGSDVKSGVIITGNTLAINRNVITTGTTTPDGITMTAEGNVTIASTVATDSKTGISIALSHGNTVQTTGAGIIRALNPNTADNLGQLTLTAPKNAGTINVKTNVGTIQAVLGGRNISIDNGAHTGPLLATTLGFIKDDNQNPVDLPIGNFELWTGGELQLANVNDYLVDGSTKPLPNQYFRLHADSIQALTPNSITTPAWITVQLEPYHTSNAIDVGNTAELPGGAGHTGYTTDPIIGLLQQFNPLAKLIIGGSDQKGDISVLRDFTLGSMEVTFWTQGKVLNDYNVDPSKPTYADNSLGYPTVSDPLGSITATSVHIIDKDRPIVTPGLFTNNNSTATIQGTCSQFFCPGGSHGQGAPQQPDNGGGGGGGSGGGGGGGSGGSGGSSGGGGSGTQPPQTGGGTSDPGSQNTTGVVDTTSGGDNSTPGSSPTSGVTQGDNPGGTISAGPDGGGAISGGGGSSGGSTTSGTDGGDIAGGGTTITDNGPTGDPGSEPSNGPDGGTTIATGGNGTPGGEPTENPNGGNIAGSGGGDNTGTAGTSGGTGGDWTNGGGSTDTNVAGGDDGSGGISGGIGGNGTGIAGSGGEGGGTGGDFSGGGSSGDNIADSGGASGSGLSGGDGSGTEFAGGGAGGLGGGAGGGEFAGGASGGDTYADAGGASGGELAGGEGGFGGGTQVAGGSGGGIGEGTSGFGEGTEGTGGFGQGNGGANEGNSGFGEGTGASGEELAGGFVGGGSGGTVAGNEAETGNAGNGETGSESGATRFTAENTDSEGGTEEGGFVGGGSGSTVAETGNGNNENEGNNTQAQNKSKEQNVCATNNNRDHGNAPPGCEQVRLVDRNPLVRIIGNGVNVYHGNHAAGPGTPDAGLSK